VCSYDSSDYAAAEQLWPPSAMAKLRENKSKLAGGAGRLFAQFATPFSPRSNYNWQLTRPSGKTLQAANFD